MSRPIDADALMKAMYHRAFETDGDTMWQSGCWVRYRAIEQTVKEQPTIEPERKKSRWINVDKNNVGYCESCLARGRAWMNFCHNCGADMREGAEQE